MGAGSRDQKIMVRVATVTRNSMNEEVRSWADLRPAWARVIEGQGREYLKGGAVQASARVVFVLRFSPIMQDITSKNRVVWKNRTFELVDVTGTLRSGELWLHGQEIFEG
tara:strand:+ start:593 stop:922 length:330 start_codon:yes stop_codon:yes gene_type:complete